MINFKFSKRNREEGFVILFAVVITSVILAVVMSVASIAFKEIRFYTSAKDSNNAFFAADIGAECALMNDKSSSNSFVVSGSGIVDCLGSSVGLSGGYPKWNFILSRLGPDAKGCAKIIVDKSLNPITVIISRGYNNGGEAQGSCTQGPDTLERQIELTY